MSNIINLRITRKSRERAAARKAADVNAVKHGQTKSTKKKTAAEHNKLNDHLNGHKRDSDA